MSSAGSRMENISEHSIADSSLKQSLEYPPKKVKIRKTITKFKAKTRKSITKSKAKTRKDLPDDLTIKVILCKMEVRLRDDMRRASYRWDYTIQVLSGEIVPKWVFFIPFSQNKVNGIWVEDYQGHLEWNKDEDDENKDRTRLSISFRNPLKKKEKYSFRFGYESETFSIVMPGFLRTTVVYNDWCFHDSRCDKIETIVTLPSNSKAMDAIPLTDIDKDTIKFEVLKRKPNEYFSYMIAYHKKKIGKQVWIMLAASIISGIVGAIITLFFN